MNITHITFYGKSHQIVMVLCAHKGDDEEHKKLEYYTQMGLLHVRAHIKGTREKWFQRVKS